MKLTRKLTQALKICSIPILLYGCSATPSVDEGTMASRQSQDMDAYYAQQRAYYEQQRAKIAQQPVEDMSSYSSKRASSSHIQKKKRSHIKKKKHLKKKSSRRTRAIRR